MVNKRLKYLLIAFIVLLLAGAVWFYFRKRPDVGKRIVRQPIVKVAIGKVESITGQSLKLRVESPDVLNGQTGSIDYLVGDQTEFFRQTSKTKPDAQFGQEISEFNAYLKKNSLEGKDIAGFDPPSFYINEKIGITDIKTGDEVEVYKFKTAVADQNAMLAKVMIKRAPAALSGEEGQRSDLVLAGEIVAVASERISLRLDNPEALGATSTGPITDFSIGGDVKVFKKIEKSKEKYFEEQKAFNEKVATMANDGKNVAGLEPPAAYEIEAKSVTDLAKGQKVEITVNTGGIMTLRQIDIIK
jgi:hypothetical protein